MKKQECLEHWAQLPTDADPLTVMQAIPYKADGRTFGTDGVRIDGSPEFIDAVLGRLKPLLAGENCVTRLSLSRNPANSDFKSNPNSDGRNEVCYIRLHVRGGEAQIMRGLMERATAMRGAQS